METNCPNCGAPKNFTKRKCEYCGTHNFNFKPLRKDNSMQNSSNINSNERLGLQQMLSPMASLGLVSLAAHIVFDSNRKRSKR